MSISGPVICGDFSQNNKTSLTFNPLAAVPAGALIWIVAGSNVSDSANLTFTDTQGNNYELQAFNQLPGTGVTFIEALVRNANALATTDTITLTSDTRANFDGAMYFHTGALGNIFSRDVEFFQTVNPIANVSAQAGMELFGAIAVAGPSSDAFTNDVNFGPDQKIKLATTNATIHASDRSPVPVAGPYSFAPVLGTARKSMIILHAFN